MIRPVVLVSIALASTNAFPQTPEEARSLRQFVQAFYDWYVPIANKQAQGPTCSTALKRRPECFKAELAKSIQADLNAQAKSPSRIVDMDWDPFLNSQDPEQHYKVSSIKPSKIGFLVNVHAITSGKMAQTADVIAEVSEVNGQWVFSNFRSSKGTDLLSSLAYLRKQRQNTPK